MPSFWIIFFRIGIFTLHRRIWRCKQKQQQQQQMSFAASPAMKIQVHDLDFASQMPLCQALTLKQWERDSTVTQSPSWWWEAWWWWQWQQPHLVSRVSSSDRLSTRVFCRWGRQCEWQCPKPSGRDWCYQQSLNDGWMTFRLVLWSSSRYSKPVHALNKVFVFFI